MASFAVQQANLEAAFDLSREKRGMKVSGRNFPILAGKEEATLLVGRAVAKMGGKLDWLALGSFYRMS